MKKVVVLYDDAYLKHVPPRYHCESPVRVKKIIEHLRSSDIPEDVFVKPRKATVDNVCLVHDRSYVDLVLRMCERGETYLDGDTYLSPGTIEAALTAVGAGLTGVDLIQSGETRCFYAPVRPPGHHAGFTGRALTAPTQGFCIFNNIAITAEYAVRKGFKKVAIIDVDAHHGNGTQEIFYHRSDVLYISLHQDPFTLYPGTGFVHEVGEGEGEGFNINIPLPPGTGDDVYIEIIEELIPQILRQYKPDLVLVSLGFDPHVEDPLTNLATTLNTYEALFLMLKRELERGTFRGLGYFLEGGYIPEVLALGSEMLVKIMLEREYRVPEDKTETKPSIMSRARNIIKDVRQTLSRYWNLA